LKLQSRGVDTHADSHVAAALDPVGGLLGVREFPVSAAGYAGLLSWLGGFGTVCLVGIEGTGSYGAGLARHMSAAGVRVVEVDRSDRQDRRRQGKSDPLDAVSAARAAQSGRARGAPKGRDGAVEAIRALMIAKRSARSERTQAINQARALIVTGPEDLRARFTAHATADLVAELAALRPRPGAVVGYHTRIALRELGRRAEFPDSQIERLDDLIGPLITGHAPGLLALHGVGSDTAAILLIAAGDHPERLRSEAAWGAEGLADMDQGAVANFPVAGYAVTDAWLAKYPHTAAALARALAEGQEIAATNRIAVQRAVVADTHVTPQIAAVVALGTFPSAVNRAQLQRVADLMYRDGQLKHPFNVTRLTS